MTPPAARIRRLCAPRLLSALAALAPGLAACSADPGPPPQIVVAPPPAQFVRAPAIAAAEVPQYVVDVDGRPAGSVIDLDGRGSFGVIADGARVVVPAAGEPTLSIDAADPPIRGAARVPAWLGGGFLFRSSSALYLTYAFDGWLRPVAELPGTIEAVTFGPKGVLVRAASGERWAFDLPSGARKALAPQALVDVAALGDGRAVALLEGGGALLSIDGGQSWRSPKPALAVAPTGVLAVSGELFVTEPDGRVLRVDPGGTLTPFERMPASEGPRAKDPRWRKSDPPLRVAMRSGARTGPGTAVVAASGDVLEVDLRTGAILRVAPGVLPAELACEAVRTPGDVLFVCAAPKKPSVVASQLFGASGLRIERVFPADAPFYASDDGSLVYAGPCAADAAPATPRACSRDALGRWTEVAYDGPKPTSTKPGDVKKIAVRWIPRAGRAPLAVASDGPPASYDPASGETLAFRVTTLPADLASAVTSAIRKPYERREGIVDRRWSSAPGGALRFWLDGARAASIGADGSIAVSAFSFDHAAFAGASAFARSQGGRAWQSLDRGGAWVEVAAPPGQRAADVRGCSEVGCDLGAWLRVGWDAVPPAPRPDPPKAPPAPALSRAPAAELTCVASGASRSSSIDGTSNDPGLGADRSPAPAGDAAVRVVLSRRLVLPPHGLTSDGEEAPRALVRGLWPDVPAEPKAKAGAHAGQLDVAFLEPFDPTGAVQHAALAQRDVVALARAAGMLDASVFAHDAITPVSAVPLLAVDATGATAVLLSAESERGMLLVTVRSSLGSADLAWAPGLTGSLVSAAALPSGETALLTVDSDGVERVASVRGGGVTPLGSVPAPPTAGHYPANPDAIALGPAGEIVLLRTPSGSEPASVEDPALVLSLRGDAPVALAPWSTLTAASDPACRASGGYRAVVRTLAPWVRIRGARPGGVEATGVMTARVRWSRTRVCLEAIEVPESASDTGGTAIETDVIARFTGVASAGRVAVGLGSEARQALACSLATPEAVKEGPPPLPEAPTQRD